MIVKLARSVAIAMVLGASQNALAQEPVFSPGVETRSLAVASSRVADEGFEDSLLAGWEIVPGFRLSGTVPVRQATKGVRRRVGLGDATISARTLLAGSDSLATRLCLDAGFVLPTASTHGRVPLGGGSTDFTGGLTLGTETHRWLGWTAFRFHFATQTGGDEIAGHAAAGFRPFSARDDFDFVLLGEADAFERYRDPQGGVSGTTAERTLTIAPGASIRLERVRVKAGAAIPIATTRLNPPWRLLFALEVLL